LPCRRGAVSPPAGRVAGVVAGWQAALAEPPDGAVEYRRGYPRGDVTGLVSRQSEVGEGAVPDAEAGHLAVWSPGRYLAFGEYLAEEPGRGPGIGCQVRYSRRSQPGSR
jgi:hypothetical protein